jgi:hypothetical protein
MTNLNNIIREVSLCANIDWQGECHYSTSSFKLHFPVFNRKHKQLANSKYLAQPFILCELYAAIGHGHDVHLAAMEIEDYLREKYISDCKEGFDFKEPLWLVMHDILFFLRDKQFWVLEIALENGDEYVEYKDEN